MHHLRSNRFLAPDPLLRHQGFQGLCRNCINPIPVMCNLEVASIDRPGNQTQLEVSPVQVFHFAPFCSCAQILSRYCLNWSMLAVGAMRWRFSALPNFKTLRARATAKTAQGTRIQRGWVTSECGCLDGHFGTVGGS